MAGHAVAEGAGYVPLEHVADSKSTRRKVSLFSISANLVMSGLGAGILSLPWAMAGAGIVPSVVTIMVVMALNAATIMVLVIAAEHHQAFDLGSLLAHLPGRMGPAMQMFNNTLTVISVGLTLVGYIVVMADAMEPFFLSLVGLGTDQEFNFLLVRAPVLAASGLLVLPMCFVDQARLSVSSVVGICVTVYLIVVVAFLFTEHGPHPNVCWYSGVHEGTLTMFSTLMQCVIIQMCILPMYEELQDRTPRRFSIAVISAFVFLGVLFAAFSAVAYTVFGPRVAGNVMTNLPHDSLGSVARLGMILVMLAVFPIMMMSMVAPVRHWEESTGRTNGHVSAVVSICIVAASVVGAAFVAQLGALNAMNGSMQVSCFIGLFPGLTGLYLLGAKGMSWHIAMYILLFISVVVSFMGLIYTDNAVADLENACWWRTS